MLADDAATLGGAAVCRAGGGAGLG